MTRKVFVKLGFFGANNDTRRKEFGTKCLGEFYTLSVFAGHWKTEDIDGASAKPIFDSCYFVIHRLIIA